MESQKFEELEPLEEVETNLPQSKELKEYEKLLLAESNRELFEKASNLVKFGCFNQEQRPTVDFSRHVRIDSAKKFKGLYTLYQNMDTMELVFILPLVENNKGDDKEEKTNLAPYAYDCIIVESMDEETYQLVSKAAKNNIRTVISVAYKAAWGVFFGVVLLGLALFIYSLIVRSMVANITWHDPIFTAISYTASFIAGEVVALPLLVLMTIKYKKYKDQ